MTGTAIIAGAGALPAALAAASAAGPSGAPLIAALDGFAPRGIEAEITFRVERLVPFLNLLLDRGISRVVFAGAVQRPRLDPSLFDPQTAQMVPRLLAAMGQGDDATLRAVIGIFEDSGLQVAGVEEIAPDLVPGAGLLAGTTGPQEEKDAERAIAIVEALGRVDVGQGCVVQQGLCLAVEALPGTDAMLAGVAALPAALRPDPARGRGLFYKAPKPLQDRRIDLPAIGPQTVAAVAAAGLGGIVWQAGGVICLQRDEMVAAANAAGLFLWAR